MAEWRNGSASLSGGEGCVFESRLSRFWSFSFSLSYFLGDHNKDQMNFASIPFDYVIIAIDSP